MRDRAGRHVPTERRTTSCPTRCRWVGAEDNFSFWVPNFSSQHYNDMIFSRSGLKKRVRLDLTGPDGQPGIDLRGYTTRNHYREMSKGACDVTGKVTGRSSLPHSEAWYSADSCEARVASDVGHPDNPRGTGEMVVDAVNILAAQGFDFSEFDQEGQGDLDGDTDVVEPDGVIDHMVLVHAGADQAGDGGDQARTPSGRAPLSSPPPVATPSRAPG